MSEGWPDVYAARLPMCGVAQTDLSDVAKVGVTQRSPSVARRESGRAKRRMALHPPQPNGSHE